MKIFIRSAAAALALSLVGVTGAEAQLSPPTWTAPFGNLAPGGCATATFGNFVAPQPVTATTYCIGTYSGNNTGGGEAFALGEINAAWGSMGVNVTTSTTLNDGESDANLNWANTGGGGGSVTFDALAPFTGDFVFALKAGNSWSAYLMTGLVNLTSFDFVTYDPQQANSHFTYYNNDISIPEPTTLFLLGTGLLAMSFLVWRRREEVLA